MNPISAFFVRNIIAVYSLYGLAFLVMGLALAIAGRRTSTFRFAVAITPLAWFGILHGIHEWIEMFQKVAALAHGYTPSVLEESLRILPLVASFLFLLMFGMLLLSNEQTGRRRLLPSLGAMLGLWMLALGGAWWMLRPNLQETVAIADVLSRYVLGIPGALLGTWALMKQQRTFREHDMPQFGRDLVWAATAMFLYGIVGQLFVRQTALVPSNLINSTAFLQWFGIPVQLFRGVMAMALAVFMVRALNAFELESQRRLDEAIRAKAEAHESQIESERAGRIEIERLYTELQHREELLGNLLHNAVDAQEAERQRIARELHDATGQSLTAIGLGLRGVETSLQKENHKMVDQVRELGAYSSHALTELRDIISNLRPSHLDDLGLAPTLRWYAKAFSKRWNIPCELSVTGEPKRLPPDFETVLFRIGQEALTNIAKHAQATRAQLLLHFTPDKVMLEVRDNGRGFTPERTLPRPGAISGWGILGMRERASLVGGQVEIIAEPGHGTCVRVNVPLRMEANHDRQDSVVAGR